MDNKFIIIVTQYNAVEYIKLCLDSIVSQTYKNYEVVVVDDCSTDGTLDIIRTYPFHVISHPKNICCSAINTIEAIRLVSPKDDDIIVLVSGDDYLADEHVLDYLNKAYQDDVLMTYGQFEPLSKGYSNFCKPIDDIRGYRHSGEWLASHLITFKKKLWDLIDDDDLRREDGDYGHCSFDVAILYPMLEMCGDKYHKFIDRVLYIYNDMNPSCIYKILPKENLKEAEYFRNKTPYNELL
jgi:glycosyltransferase involved in cell wall biosynthesis